MREQDWRSSSYSQANGGECVEWNYPFALAHGVVPVRDSKDRNGPALMLSPEGWASFINAVCGDEFDV